MRRVELASVSSAESRGDVQAAKRVGRNLRMIPAAWNGFPQDGQLGTKFCGAGADWASDTVSRRSSSDGVTHNGGVFRCLAKKQRSVALARWVGVWFSRLTASMRSLGLDIDFVGHGVQCPPTVRVSLVTLDGVDTEVTWLKGLWLQHEVADGM